MAGRQADRSQAFSDIFGRPTSNRPAYNHLQGIRPSPSMRLPPGAPSPYVVAGPRPQSVAYGPPAGGAGLPYPPQSQAQAHAAPAAHQAMQHALGAASGHGHGGQPRQTSAAGPHPQLQHSQGYGHGHGHVLPSPPPAPQGPANRALDSTDSYGSGGSGGRHSVDGFPGAPQPHTAQATFDPRTAATPAAQYAAEYGGQARSHHHHYQPTDVGSAPPRLPSFDASAGGLDWFDTKSASSMPAGSLSASSAGTSVAEAQPSPSSSGREIDGPSSRSISDNRVPSIRAPSRQSAGAMTPASALVVDPSRSGPLYASNSQNSSRRSFTASSTLSAATTNTQDYNSDQYQQYPARDSPASGISSSSGQYTAQHPDGVYPLQQQQQQQQQYAAYPDHVRGNAGIASASTSIPYDQRTSMDSDHTTYYIPSASSDARGAYGFPSGPPSSSAHGNYYQPSLSHGGSSGYHNMSSSQSGYPAGAAPHPPSASSSYYHSGPSSAGPMYASSSSGHHSSYQQGGHLRPANSRKSSESVRVYPTQPKSSSAYGDRAFSFSGIERPNAALLDMRQHPSNGSPRPASFVSELPTAPSPSSTVSGVAYGQPGPHPAQQRPYHPHHAHRASSNSITAPRRAPVVYPALLSRVSDAFKMRISLAERVKDGLSYKDAFDGREAVDKIAYIIRTTDRNLALLLGRALDAQKFFHDVTYDHRLRDSPNELYQFRERLHSANMGPGNAMYNPYMAQNQQDQYRSQHMRPPSPTDTMLSEDSAGPVGVFTLLTDCYSPTCTRDRLCYSIACPRRLEQQARLNLKPRPGLKRSNSEEGLLGDDDRLGSEPGMLWIHTVSKEISDSVDDKEKKRQEVINELIYTERDFVRDLEYLRDKWMTPLKTGSTISESRREQFVHQVFWNVTEIHGVNIKLAESLTRRQKQQPIVQSIGDLLLKFIPEFGPFVKYGAHQIYGKYEFEKEKGSNPAFLKFVETTERLPESRKLELNGYLTKPTTRLARYPLLLETILKATPEGNPDKENIPKAVNMIRELLVKVNHESGRSEARFNLAQLDQQLIFKPGEAVDLKLRDENRDLLFKGPLKKRGGTQSDSADLQVYLFDHAVLMVKTKANNKNTEQVRVYRKPIPLELLVVSATDDPMTLRASTARPKSLMSRSSNTSKLNISTNGSSKGSIASAPDPTSKQGFPITFTHLGRKGYSLTLWSPSWAGRKKWLDKIEQRQLELRERSLVFDTSVLSEGFFTGVNRVTCAAPFDGGTQMVYGTDNGVYLANLLATENSPIKVVAVPNVTQVDVLEDYGILIVLADKAVQTFVIDGLDPNEAVVAAKRARKISTNASFFKTGVCLNRTLVCIVKSGTVSSTIKTLEPIDHHGKSGKKPPAIRKFLQGGSDLLRIYKEFYIPTESSSVHFLKSKLCVGCTKGFEIVDLDTLDTQGLLDPADSSLDFVQKRDNVKPLSIYRVDGDFLLCYDEFAFYVNKNGWRARSNWLVHWEGHPTAFALHYPYVLAFEPNFVEVRHVDSGALMQIIPGSTLRLLFADTPPSASSSALVAAQHNAHFIQQQYGPNALRQLPYGANYQAFNPPVRLPGPRKQIIFACDSGVLTLRETTA